MIYPASFLLNISDLHLSDVNCTQGIPWIWNALGICVISPKDGLAVVFGIVNIIAFLLFGIPQMIRNFMYGIPEGSISPQLLSFWTLGDALNFIGAILVKELLLQIIVGAYGIVMDLILVFQYLYYTSKTRKARAQLSQANDSNENTNAHHINVRSTVIACITLGSFTTVTTTPAIHFLPNIYAYIGYTLGWVSAVLYLFSRVPQIYLNYRRKATDGLSIGVFVCTIIGNLAYGLQIICTSTEINFILKSLPWLVGSLGVLFLDFIILSQFFKYKKIPPTLQSNVLNDDIQTICLSSSENTSQESLNDQDSKPLLNNKIRI